MRSGETVRLEPAFGRAERHVGGGLFFSGVSPGKVDMAWLPLLHRAAIVEDHDGHDMLAAHPRVKAWQRRLLDTGIAQDSVAAGSGSCGG